jgi:hypothetical protein
MTDVSEDKSSLYALSREREISLRFKPVRPEISLQIRVIPLHKATEK